MTTRNFRVNNGLEVGDIVISASANTIVGLATAAPSSDGDVANKKYVDDQAAAALTLTNKTLTAPKFADAGFIADANGNQSLVFQTTSSAVNEFDITNAATGNAPILAATGDDTNIGIAITAKGTGAINLNAGSDVVIPTNIGLHFTDANEKIESDGTDLTINSGAKINLTATSDVVVPANVGITFGTGEKIEGDNTDLTITSGAKITLAATSDVILPPNVGLVLDTAGNEKIESDGTDISISVGSGGDINVPASIGVTFGDDGEKIEGDGTDLTIASSNLLNLTATTDVVIPTNVGLHFTDANEKIESDGTDLTINAGADINLTATTDINVPANVGLTFGDDAEKIEGDGTDLTITGNNINLSPTADVNIPANKGLTFATAEKIESDGTDLSITVGSNGDINIGANIGLTFGDDGEKIEGDGTDLTISGNNIKLTAAADVIIPTNIGLHFTDANEKIESDGTDLTINSGAKINLTATSDVHIPNDVGIAFGAGGEKIESDGTDLTVTSTGALNLTVTGTTTVSGDLVVTGDYTVNGTTTTNNSVNLTVDDNIIELNSGISASSNDAGIIIERGSTGNNAAIIWDESADKFSMGLTTAVAGDKSGGITVAAGTLVVGIEGDVTGDLTGTASLATAVTCTANNTANESVFITFVDGATGTQGIETDTNLTYNPSTNVLSTLASSAQYADVAERFEADAPMEVGSVVELGGSAEITEATSDLSEDVFGVISFKPGFMMNSLAGEDATHPFVAMTGRTPVRVSGAVNKGQRLVSSSIKGCARAAATGESISPFNVIGRALESNTEAGIKLVNCAVRTNN